MRNLAIPKLVLFVAVFFVFIFYFYNNFGLLAGLITLVIYPLLWIFYCHLENKYLGYKVEKYISLFSSADDLSYEHFDIYGEFYLKGKYCDGWINFDSSGVALKLNSFHYIPWNNISRFTILNIENSTIARLFLVNNEVEESKLFVPWDNSFKEKIPPKELMKLE